MRVPQQIQRLGAVVLILIAAVLVLRFVVVPGSFFNRELHADETVRREVSRPLSYAGADACKMCHEEEYDTKAKGFHKTVACETCHGPSAKHAEAPDEVKPTAPRDRKFCPVCHAYDASRPTGFPQINPTLHNPLKPCYTCHNPHDPVPPEVPHDCSACHGQIARTKAISSHALLPCTTCHDAKPQHRTNPRSALPTKPDSREFCGKCHGKDATEPDAPKVDLSEHGGSYLCWQCHYPHMPEGR